MGNTKWSKVFTALCLFLLTAVGVYAESAREIIAQSGVKGGLIVHLGCGDGKLTADLRANNSYLVQGLDTDAKKVAAAREHIKSLGIYGQVSVDLFDGKRLPYADNLVNLLIAEDLGKIPMDELMRVLCPNGVAFIKNGGEWKKSIKPRPDNIDEWTHFLHDADNNAVAHDELVGPPRRMQWVVEPLWLRSHETPSGISAAVSAAGRVFYILDEGPIGITDKRLPDKWSLIARDAFNGVQLWKKPLEGWGWSEWSRETFINNDWTVNGPKRGGSPNSVMRRLVSDGERVFVTLGYYQPLSILDAATGQVIRTIHGTEGTDEILHSDGIVLLVIKNLSSETAKGRGKTIQERLLALGADTGKTLWERSIKGVAQLSLAIDRGRVFYQCAEGIVSLDLSTGDERWCASDDKTRMLTLVVHDDVVLVSDRGKLRALSAQTGEPMWTHKEKASSGAPSLDLFVANGLVWRGIDGTGLDLRTGKVMKKLSIKNLRSKEHHHRCYRNKATDQYIMSAKEGIELLDLLGDGETNRNSRNNWLRGACKYGIMPANGFLYVPPDQCFCEPGAKLLGFCALAAAESASVSTANDVRFEKGPAFGKIGSQTGNPHDWPTYRHDGERSGSSATDVPADVTPGWRVKLGGRLSAPVVADGKLFVATVDTHTIHALDVRNGTSLWTYTTGGRVDSPPTIYRGLALFGSADGWVYCLRASDGELAWRFRAAPRERLIGSFGQVESAWPVHGSVLIQNNVAYVSAGRSSFLDGGVFIYGLDPVTGEVLYETCLEGPHGDVSKEAEHSFWLDGNRNDVLVGDGTYIYQGQAQVDNKLVKQDTPFISKFGDRKMGLHLFSTAGLLDDSWYNRAFWMYSARWPGFYIGNQSPKTGQILVFDDKRTYGVKVFTRRNVHSPLFFPAADGYLLFADKNDTEPQLVDEKGEPKPVVWLPQSDYDRGRDRGIKRLTDQAIDKDKFIGFTRSKPPLWKEWYPVRIRAMVKTGDRLFVAGPPDVLEKEDPLAAFEGRRGAVLCAASAVDGKKLHELKLDTPPVFDGLIAANGRLFISLKDGSVMSLGRE